MKQCLMLTSILMLSVLACVGEDENAELTVEDLIVGTGKEAKSGDVITVHYTGRLENGSEFDSSRRPGREPLVLTLGIGQVIKGWDQGIPGMKVAGKRRLTIPPHLGYGNRAVGSIPANSTLIFDVELLDVE